MASYLVLPTPVGEVAVRAEGGAITGLFLKGQRHAPALSWEELKAKEKTEKQKSHEEC